MTSNRNEGYFIKTPHSLKEQPFHKLQEPGVTAKSSGALCIYGLFWWQGLDPGPCACRYHCAAPSPWESFTPWYKHTARVFNLPFSFLIFTRSFIPKGQMLIKILGYFRLEAFPHLGQKEVGLPSNSSCRVLSLIGHLICPSHTESVI